MNTTNESMLNFLYRSRLPSRELTTNRLQQEATGIVGAGIETITRTLVVGTYHIMSNKPIQSALLQELRRAMPDPAQMLDIEELLKLPYLTACVNEGIAHLQFSALLATN